MPGAPFIYYGDEIGMRYVENLTSVEGGYGRTGSERDRNAAGSPYEIRLAAICPVRPIPTPLQLQGTPCQEIRGRSAHEGGEK